MRTNSNVLQRPEVFHVDFTTDEAREIQQEVRRMLDKGAAQKDPFKDLAKLLRERRGVITATAIASQLNKTNLPGRSSDDISNFLHDIVHKSLGSQAQILSLERDPFGKHDQDVRASRMSSLLLAREISGNSGFGTMRRLENFTNEFKKSREDALELRAEYVDCAGDISTISWVSNQGYVCGTTVHSDTFNQQYNKPGNLVLGSVPLGSLRAYSDHRIVRPLVEKGENSTEEMRRSQDPWVYSSVVSSDYDSVYDRTYTSSFDKTVKVWKVEKSGKSMEVLGTWHHDGLVNFVQASRHPTGMVATASHVPSEAVRIYMLNSDDLSSSAYKSYSCSRIIDNDGQVVVTDKWAYYPSTMRWGLHSSVQHFLLAGYSPRGSNDGNDNDIPSERLNTGEVCLWNGLTGERIKITSASTQNIFEVLWHPTQACFVVGSSPSSLNVKDGIRTQVRIFRPGNTEETWFAYSEIKTLDCPALDINELSIMPNSYSFCYITAGCTDGKTYVWDTAKGDTPIHVLAHGLPTEELSNLMDREREDTGVKFTAWGNSPDRFYTGSSDGIIKVWNVRSQRKPLVRVLLECPAQVTYGAFSPDYSKLVIGDASGRVFLLSVEEKEERPAQFVKLLGDTTRRRPVTIIPHPEPPPPPGTEKEKEEDSGITRATAYLVSGQLQDTGNPTIGAVKGPRYADTGLYCEEAHYLNDPFQELYSNWECLQQNNVKIYTTRLEKPKSVRKIKEDEFESLPALHEKNLSLELDMSKLSLETRRELEAEKAEVDVDDYGFVYYDDEIDVA